MQGLPFPIPVAQEFERIEMLQDPERTAALEALNDEIFGSLTDIFSIERGRHRRKMTREIDLPHKSRFRNCATILRSRTRTLRSGLSTREAYATIRSPRSWDEYLLQELGAESGEEIAFAHAMVELEKLLTLFHDGNRVLPGLSFERIWFLHSLRGPERMLQTRAVLGMLTAELAACTSA